MTNVIVFFCKFLLYGFLVFNYWIYFEVGVRAEKEKLGWLAMIIPAPHHRSKLVYKPIQV
jgi:hypothetical protein